MKKSKELKRIAREILNNRYGVPMGAFFVTSVITLAIEIPFSLSMGDHPGIQQYIISYLADFLISLLAAILAAGQLRIHLDMARGKEVKVSQVFSYFKNRPERYIGSAFLLSILSLLCLLPLFAGFLFFYVTGLSDAGAVAVVVTALVSIVLMLYVSICYALVTYLLVDNQNMKVLDALRESRRLLKGNIWRYLCLSLSFLGWSILILPTLGIASLWIQPYITQTFTQFYLTLSTQQGGNSYE